MSSVVSELKKVLESVTPVVVREAGLDDARPIVGMPVIGGLERGLSWKIAKQLWGSLVTPKVVVAESGRRIVGAACGEKNSSDLFVVESIVVDKDWRGCGVGRQMLNVWLEECGSIYLDTMTSSARNVFLRMGFQPVTTEDVGAEPGYLVLRNS